LVIIGQRALFMRGVGDCQMSDGLSSLFGYLKMGNVCGNRLVFSHAADNEKVIALF